MMIEDRLFHEINQISRFITKEANERLKPYGLFSSQWAILFCLKRFEPMTQSELSNYLHVEAPTVTRTVSRLEQNGWVIREEGKDKRERIIVLTEQSRKTLPDVEETMQQFEVDMMRTFSKSEQDTLHSLVKQLGYSFKHYQEEAHQSE